MAFLTTQAMLFLISCCLCAAASASSVEKYGPFYVGRNGSTRMIERTDRSVCMLTGMFSSAGDSWTCQITSRMESNFEIWHLTSRGNSNNQNCWATCMLFTSAVSEDQCLAEAVRVHGPKVTANRQHLVAGTWGHVPLGCSVASGFDWAAHYNRGPQQGNDGTYTVVLSSDPSWSSTHEASASSLALAPPPSRPSHPPPTALASSAQSGETNNTQQPTPMWYPPALSGEIRSAQPTLSGEYVADDRNTYVSMVLDQRDSICFLTHFYSSSGDSYTCRIESEAGRYRLKLSGTSRNKLCKARCFESLPPSNDRPVDMAPMEYHTSHETTMTQSVNSGACFMTGAFSSSGQSYHCRIRETPFPGNYPLWSMSAYGDSSNRHCYAHCISFLSWDRPLGRWEFVGGSFAGPVNLTLTWGVETVQGEAYETSYSESVTAKMSQSTMFGTYELSTTASTSVSQSTSSSVATSYGRQLGVSCPAPSSGYVDLFQWVVDLGVAEGNRAFEGYANRYYCLYSPTPLLVPQCPLGYCAENDPTCQTCTDGWQA